MLVVLAVNLAMMVMMWIMIVVMAMITIMIMVAVVILHLIRGCGRAGQRPRLSINCVPHPVYSIWVYNTQCYT